MGSLLHMFIQVQLIKWVYLTRKVYLFWNIKNNLSYLENLKFKGNFDTAFLKLKQILYFYSKKMCVVKNVAVYLIAVQCVTIQTVNYS